MAIDPQVNDPVHDPQDATPTSAMTSREATAPRAFAQGTGVLLQVFGVLLFLTSGCVCATSGLWDPVMSRGQVYAQLEQGQPMQPYTGDRADDAATLGTMMTVMSSTVAGVALAGFGLGLQTDQRRAGWGAMVTSGLLLVTLVIAGLGLWYGRVSWPLRLWHGLLTLAAGTIFMFVLKAFREVLADPPPPGMQVLPKDFEIPSMYKTHH